MKQEEKSRRAKKRWAEKSEAEKKEFSRKMREAYYSLPIEERRRMAKAVSEKNKGRKVSQETRRKISIGNLGKKLTQECKKKMSEAKIGKKRKPFSDEHKSKMAKSIKRSWIKRNENLSVRFDISVWKDHENGVWTAVVNDRKGTSLTRNHRLRDTAARTAVSDFLKTKKGDKK